MEPYVIAVIPVFAAYLGWLTNRVLKLVEVQATTVAKLDAVNVRIERNEDRVDVLYVRG